jgi:hypothetical protein
VAEMRVVKDALPPARAARRMGGVDAAPGLSGVGRDAARAISQCGVAGMTLLAIDPGTTESA